MQLIHFEMQKKGHINTILSVHNSLKFPCTNPFETLDAEQFGNHA